MKPKDKQLLEKILWETTPVGKYVDLDAWYVDFKKKMRKGLKTRKKK